MPIEKRTRVEIFLPLRFDIPAYQVAIDWMASEFVYLRGGATLTAPFAGFFASAGRYEIVEDAIRVLFCDLDQDIDDEQDRADALSFCVESHRIRRNHDTINRITASRY